jgi:DNA-binding transcriptional MocR family regulator
VGWALDTPTGSVSRKAVLIALANATNHHTGLCCPSLKRLATEADLSVSTVQRAIDALIEMGLVAKSERQRENGSKTSNVYTFPTTPYGHGDHSPLVTVTTPEPELRTRKEPSAATPRERNEIWDALVYVFPEYRGELTPSENKKIGKVCAELKAAGATRDQIVARASSWPAHFDSATLTPHALVNHWSTLGRRPLRRR